MGKKEISKSKKILDKIVSNSKDEKLAKKLINDYKVELIESLHKPSYVDIKKTDVEKKLEGSTYEMAICKDGTAVYKVYGGYTVVVEPRLQSLAGLIEEYINIDRANLSENERENLDLDLSAFAYIMSAPIVACSDFGFKYELAAIIVKKMQELVDYSMSQELKEDTREDTKKNIEFEEAMRGMETLKEELEEYDVESQG